ncbi:hypothetical protein Bbelb_251600 [Branchiostoma belcheri]|nr:hypothetical protein Bbelb_251600 [Branchiostoma belcheri]
MWWKNLALRASKVLKLKLQDDMGRKLRHLLIFLLLILKEPNTPEELNLDDNNLNSIQASTFSNLPKIYSLRLSGNKISSIETGQGQSQAITESNTNTKDIVMASGDDHQYDNGDQHDQRGQGQSQTITKFNTNTTATTGQGQSQAITESNTNTTANDYSSQTGYQVIAPPLDTKSQLYNTEPTASNSTTESMYTKYNQTGKGQSQAIAESYTNTTTTIVTSGDDQAGQGQSQAITESNTNTTATEVTSGHDQTGQGQSQAITESNTNTTATVVTSDIGQLQGTTESFGIRNLPPVSVDELLAALQPNAMYEGVKTQKNEPMVAESNTNTTATVVASGHDQTGQGQSQAITESNTNTTATVMASGDDQAGQGQSQANTESNTNTTATVMASGDDQTGQGQSQAITESVDIANLPLLSGDELLAALQPNPIYEGLFVRLPLSTDQAPRAHIGEAQLQNEDSEKTDDMGRKLGHLLIFLLLILKEPNMPEAKDWLASIPELYIFKNPWQCDCKMASFWQNLIETPKVLKQITCARPANLAGQKLKDVSPKDLICKSPTKGTPTVDAPNSSFGSTENNVSSTSHPISSTFATQPQSAYNAQNSFSSSTVSTSSFGNTENKVSTTAHAVGSTLGTLSADPRLRSANNFYNDTTTSTLAVTGTFHQNDPSLPLDPGFTSAVVVGSVVPLAVGVMFTLWCKRMLRNSDSGSNASPALHSTGTTAVVATLTSGHDPQYENGDQHDQTGQGQSQTTTESNTNTTATVVASGDDHQYENSGQQDQTGQGQSQTITESYTNPTATYVNSGQHDQTGQGQSQAITESNTNTTATPGQSQAITESNTNTTATVVTSDIGQLQGTTESFATVMASGDDQTGQGQSQTITESNTNTTATVMASGHDQTGQGQSQAITESNTNTTANDYSSQTGYQVIAPPLDTKSQLYNTEPTASNSTTESIYTKYNQTGQGQSQAITESNTNTTATPNAMYEGVKTQKNEPMVTESNTNTTATVVASGDDQTGQGQSQAITESTTAILVTSGNSLFVRLPLSTDQAPRAQIGEAQLQNEDSEKTGVAYDPYAEALRSPWKHAALSELQDDMGRKLRHLLIFLLLILKEPNMPEAKDWLASIPELSIFKNPWQCDCKMANFWQNLIETPKVLKQITCARPANLAGQKLKDVSPKDLISVVVGSVVPLAVGVMFTLWCKRMLKNSDSGSNASPALHSTNTTAVVATLTSGHDHQYEDVDQLDQTGQGQSQTITGSNTNTTATVVTSGDDHQYVNSGQHDQTGQGQSQTITESYTNPTATVMASGDDPQYENSGQQDQTGQGQSQTITESYTNPTATVMTSGDDSQYVNSGQHDQTGQGQSQTITESYTNTTATVVASGHDQTGQGQSQAITESNTNPKATVMTSGPDQTGQGQGQTITESNNTPKATVVASGHDQTGQGQSQAITESNTNTTATVMTSDHDQTGQGQFKANSQSLKVGNLSHGHIIAALNPNPMYVYSKVACGHDQTGQGQSQAITESNTNTTATVVASGDGQLQGTTESFGIRNLPLVSVDELLAALQPNAMYEGVKTQKNEPMVTESNTNTTATVVASGDDQTGQGQSVTKFNTNTTATVVASGDDQTGQGQSVTKFNTNTTATVMASGDDQTGQGQSVTKFNTNTTATAVTSDNSQAQGTTRSIDIGNLPLLSGDALLAALQPNPMYEGVKSPKN